MQPSIANQRICQLKLSGGIFSRGLARCVSSNLARTILNAPKIKASQVKPDARKGAILNLAEYDKIFGVPG